jgi:DNA-binding MarR family transcriptional regulator
MSMAKSDAAVAEPTGLSPKQKQILRYLREHAGEQTYFKSRLIADELGLSAKEVGANMSAVVDAAADIDVEKWGYSSGTTWMVTA